MFVSGVKAPGIVDMPYIDVSVNCGVVGGAAVVWNPGLGVGAKVRRYSTTFGWTWGSWEGESGNGTTGLKDVGDTVINAGDAGSFFATNRVLPPSVASSSSSTGVAGLGARPLRPDGDDKPLRCSDRLLCALSCNLNIIFCNYWR